jgi:hypothetical protein
VAIKAIPQPSDSRAIVHKVHSNAVGITLFDCEKHEDAGEVLIYPQDESWELWLSWNMVQKGVYINLSPKSRNDSEIVLLQFPNTKMLSWENVKERAVLESRRAYSFTWLDGSVMVTFMVRNIHPAEGWMDIEVVVEA